MTLVNSKLVAGPASGRESEASRISMAIAGVIAEMPDFEGIQAIHIDYVSRRPDGSVSRIIDGISAKILRGLPAPRNLDDRGIQHGPDSLAEARSLHSRSLGSDACILRSVLNRGDYRCAHLHCRLCA